MAKACRYPLVWIARWRSSRPRCGTSSMAPDLPGPPRWAWAGESVDLTKRGGALPDRGVHRLPGGAQGERRVPRPDFGEVAEGVDPPAPGRADFRRDDEGAIGLGFAA